MSLNDNKFMQQPAAGKKYQASDFHGIVDGDKWDLKHTAELVGVRRPPAEDDPNPAGTPVEFKAPDGTVYRGRVASKSGSDYIIDVSNGESYLVPPTKLTKVTPELDDVRRAVREQTAPVITKVSEQEELNRLLVKVSFRERRPADNHLMEWAAQHYPDLRLVDAVPTHGRNIDLVFEIDKQAAEDVRPQGSAPHMPGARSPGLSSEEIEGTGVIGEKVEAEVKLEPKQASFVPSEFGMPQAIVSVDDIIKEAQLGQPGSADAYDELNDAARKTLAMFNTSNPDYYAAPQETEAFGEGENRGVRLWFALSGKGAADKLNPLHVTRQGSISQQSEPGSKPARGFVQLEVRNGKPDMPMLMIQGPTGPESLQEYGFSLSADIEASWDDMTTDVVQMARANPQVKAAIAKYLGREVNPDDMDLYTLVKNLLTNSPQARKELAGFVKHLDPGHREHLTQDTGVMVSNFPKAAPPPMPVGPGKRTAPSGLPGDTIPREKPVEYGVGVSPLQPATKPQQQQQPNLFKLRPMLWEKNSKQASYGACKAEAHDVLSTFGGYTAEAQAELEARLTKLAVDPAAKRYWNKYLKTTKLTDDVPRKKHKAHKKTAQHKEVDPATVDYWVNYFGSSLFNDGWYGKQMTRTIPKKLYKGDGTTVSVDSNDEEGVIGNPERAADPDTDEEDEQESTEVVESTEKTADFAPASTPPGPRAPSIKTRGPAPYRRPNYPRPNTPQPGFLEPGGFLSRQKAAPMHRDIARAGGLASQLLSHARINPKAIEYIDSILYTYQAQNPSVRRDAITSIRLQNPKYTPPAGAVVDATLRAALLPYALTYTPGAIQGAADMIQQFASTYNTQSGTEEAQTSATTPVQAMTKKIASSDYSAVIRKTDKGYEVRSEKNKNWHGGTYKSHEAAEKRLKQVEMFKHMSFVMCAGTADSDTIFNMVSEGLSITDNFSEIAQHIVILASDDAFGKKEAEQKFARSLREMLDEAVQIAETDHRFADELYPIYYKYMQQHPSLKREMLKGTDQKELNSNQIASVLYLALQERRPFKTFQKLLNKYEQQKSQQTWKELGDERKKLYKENNPSWTQRMKDKIFPSTPAQPKQPVTTAPTIKPSAKPWDRQEPEWEDVPGTGGDSSPVSEVPMETAPTATPDAPAPVAPKSSPVPPPSFGPSTGRTPKGPSEKVEPPQKAPLSKEDQATINEIAKEFGPGGKGPHRDALMSLLKVVPWPKPKTKEEEAMYKQQRGQGVWGGRPEHLGMTNYEIIENDPGFAVRFLPQHYRKDGDDASAEILRAYMNSRGLLNKYVDDELKSKVKGPKTVKRKEPFTRFKGETPAPEMDDPTKEPFGASKWDSFQISEFNNLTIPAVMRMMWNNPKGLNSFLNAMAVQHPKEIIEWGKEALPARRMDDWVDNINNRRKQWISSDSVRKPLEEEEQVAGLRGALQWTIPENPDIPAFAGKTLEQAFAKGNKKAIIDYMLKDEKRRTIFLAYVKMKHPDQYMEWVDTISEMEGGKSQGVVPKTRKKTKAFDPITKGQHKGKTVPEMLTMLRSTPKLFEFLADVSKEDPEAYANYVGTLSPENAKTLQAKVDAVLSGKPQKTTEDVKPVESTEVPGWIKKVRETPAPGQPTPSKEVEPETVSPEEQVVEAPEEQVVEAPEEPVSPEESVPVIAHGKHEGKTVQEMLTKLGDTPQAYEFLADVLEQDPDVYEEYMRSIGEDKRDKYDDKVVRITIDRNKKRDEGGGADIDEEIEDNPASPDIDEDDEEAFERTEDATDEDEDTDEDTAHDAAIRDAVYGGELNMRRWSKAGPAPFAYNAPGKDDKKDYDHKERNQQPAKAHNHFKVTRMHSTSSTRDGGYVIMELGWDADIFEDMSPQNVQHQIISFIKGLESDKYYHDFGITGRPRITMFDQEAGVAEVKVRCSDTRGVMTVTYCTDDPEVKVPLSGIR
jgi:hypothetical protein